MRTVCVPPHSEERGRGKTNDFFLITSSPDQGLVPGFFYYNVDNLSQSCTDIFICQTNYHKICSILHSI